MKFLAVLALAGSAAAFAPAQQSSSSTALSAKAFSDALGAQAPVSFPILMDAFKKKKYMSSLLTHLILLLLFFILQLGVFDPLGLIEDGNQERFDILREYEITHGRVAMLAVTGYLTTAAGIRFPGAESIPDGLASFPALYATADGQNVLMQMAAFFAVATIVNREATWVPGVKAEFVGDYRNNALDFGWDKLSAESKMKKRAIELNNGRAAQMGIFGLVTHELMGNSILPGGYLPGQV